MFDCSSVSLSKLKSQIEESDNLAVLILHSSVRSNRNSVRQGLGSERNSSIKHQNS